MTPLPKRKFSTMRSGKRKASRRTLLPAMVICKHCQKDRLPHIVCRACGKM
ncbi:MAG: 50S ribosomal protein L32 [Candidatus Roizmanbacteria bacterium]